MDKIQLSNKVTVREFVNALESIVSQRNHTKLFLADGNKKKVVDNKSLPESVYVKLEIAGQKMYFNSKPLERENDFGDIKKTLYPFSGEFNVVYVRDYNPFDGDYVSDASPLYLDTRDHVIQELSSRLDFS
jgi:hypothetical protein